MWGCLVFVLIASAVAEAAPPSLAQAFAEVDRLTQQEMKAKGIPAVSIALVSGDVVVWSRAFGEANPKTHQKATTETLFRAGSVSKLFTAIAMMQLVEEGKLDLDAPLEKVLPEFHPQNPFKTPITIRHLATHRAGLVREPPLGHYFDANAPELAKVVESLNSTTLVYEPGTITKYSNAGVTVEGRVVEKLRGKPFAGVIAERILQPLGMNRSGFLVSAEEKTSLAAGRMWTYHGTEFDAPDFEFGIGPAGNLYSTPTELGRFAIGLCSGGGRMLKPETIAAMWKPQVATPGKPAPLYGIGFRIGELEGKRRIGHAGAVYGHATEFAVLPDEKLAVVVMATMDSCNAVTRRIADYALTAMLATKAGRPLPQIPTTQPVPAATAAAIVGRYASGDHGYEVVAHGPTVSLWPLHGGTKAEIRSFWGGLMLDDRLHWGPQVVADEKTLKVGDETFPRVSSPSPKPLRQEWKGLVGEYGWPFDVLYILEKDDRLHALIEWYDLYPLTQTGKDEYAFPSTGLYMGEKLVFTRDFAGRATKVDLQGIAFPRRTIDGENGRTFTIKPQRPVPELRTISLAASPPKEAGSFRQVKLVDLRKLDPTLKFDVRYASTNNFLQTPLYTTPGSYMQSAAADALIKVHRKLAARGLGLLIFDAYRPWYVTNIFWEATPPHQRVFVADPSKGSRHNRGCAVDLTLYDLKSGKPLEMVSGYDEFSDRAYPEYPGGTSLQRLNRETLRQAMESEGFTVYEAEWWHFDFGQWRQYPISNRTFEQLETAR